MRHFTLISNYFKLLSSEVPIMTGLQTYMKPTTTRKSERKLLFRGVTHLAWWHSGLVCVTWVCFCTCVCQRAVNWAELRTVRCSWVTVITFNGRPENWSTLSASEIQYGAVERERATENERERESATERQRRSEWARESLWPPLFQRVTVSMWVWQCEK